jgi:hypothetical protein
VCRSLNVTGRNAIDDELAYERGGFSAALWGVLLACVIVIVIGQIVGLDTSTVVGCAVAFGFGASAWLYHQLETIRPRQRSEALSRVGSDLGFTFQAGVSSDQVEELGRLTESRQTGMLSQRASNLLAGAYEGIPVRVLDQYVRRSHGPDSDEERWRTVVLLSDVHGLPKFLLIPRPPLDRLVYPLFADMGVVIAATTAGFSRHYRLDGKEEDAIRALFDPGVVNFFADHPGWHVICDGCTLAIWREESGRDESTRHFRLTPQIDPRFRYVAPESIPRLISRAVAIQRQFRPA